MAECEFIAEVSSNHNQDLSRCRAFVDIAAEIGCAGIKFQLFRVEQLFAPEALAHKRDQAGHSLRERQKWELPLDFLPHIADRCEANGVKFVCTPFYLDAVEKLYPYVDAYKVGSYEILRHDLLRKIAQTDAPAYLSTGMATWEEVLSAARCFGDGYDLTLLHCVSDYPARPEDCNLSAMKLMRKRLRLSTGWSDHSCDPGVIYRAVHRWHASTIEFHLDLDGQGPEYQYGHCWLPGDIRKVIRNCNVDADGDWRKEPRPCEMEERNWRADPSDGLRPLLGVRQ